jgi:hypothetical protein
MIKPIGESTIQWYDISVTPEDVSLELEPSTVKNFKHVMYQCLMVFADKDVDTGKVWDEEVYMVSYCEDLGGWLYTHDLKKYSDSYITDGIMIKWCFVPEP